MKDFNILAKIMNMLVKDLKKCPEIKGGDGSIIREMLSPLKDDVEISFSIAHAKVMAGEETLPHRLSSSEIYYILDGQGEMYIDGEKKIVEKGCLIYIPPNSVQKIKNTGKGELSFLCIVEPAWRKENEEILG